MLLSRHERISGFDTALARALRSSIGKGRGALVEISGRDSIAAAVAASRSGEYDVFIPTIVYTGTEYGDWNTVLSNAKSLPARLEGTGVRVFEEPVLLGSPRWWHASCGRYMDLLFNRYGFSTVCVACHMYLHAARVPLARDVGANSIIAGERLTHDGRLKLNQLNQALQAYRQVLANHEVVLDMPLMETGEGQVVEDLIGDWRESDRQMACALQANYRDLNGEMSLDEGRFNAFLREFLVPYTNSVLDSSHASESRPGDNSHGDEQGLIEDSPLANRYPNYEGIAGRILAERSGS